MEKNFLGSIFLVVVGAACGSVGTYFVQEYSTAKAQKAASREQLIQTRIKLIQEMQSLLVEGRRFSVVYNMSDEAQRLEFTRLVSCANREDHAEQRDGCDLGQISESKLDRLKDIAVTQARFETTARSVNLYFCNRSLEALEKLPKGGFWWNGPSSRRDDVLAAMRADVTCP
jgi:hypothetical protein